MAEAKTIGIVGGGQLGRMLTLAAKPLGFDVVVLDPGANSPASQVGARQIIGDLYDVAALKRLASEVDYLTIEIEHLNADALEQLATVQKPVNPSPGTIRLIQDKFAQKQFMKQAGISVGPFTEIADNASAVAALKTFGGKMLLKTRHGAYDGRGNMVVKNQADIDRAFAQFGDTKLYAEKFVPFTKELAVIVARSTNGQVVTYPVVQTIHKRNICDEVLVPAPVDEAIQKRARATARKVAKHMHGAGVFAVEMFLLPDGKVLVNEIAPRVHNSGHHTIEACTTSQFEQHIRAITGLPLGKTDLVAPAAVMINILGERNGPTELMGRAEALAIPGISLHWYGKSPTKIDRKMGHITAIGGTIELARARARKARRRISV